MGSNIQIPTYPADCGRRLLPTLIDHIAATDPSRPFASLPKSTDPRDGFQDVNYNCFASAINRCCWWLEREFGRPRCEFEKIAYLTGASDIRYAVFVIAAIKTDHLSLLDAGSCSKIVTSKARIPITMDIVSHRSMTETTIPELEYWFREGAGIEDRIYPYTKTFEDARLDPFVALHTSGSTGAPKLVVNRHGTFAAQDAFQAIPALGDEPVNVHYLRGKRVFLPFPLFHGAALGVFLANNVYSGMTIILPPPLPLTAELSDLVHTHTSIDGTCLPPSVLVDITRNPQYLYRLGKLDFVAYGGGPLPKETGNNIASTGKPLLNLFGSSETSMLPSKVLDPTEWEYLKYSPFLGHEFREVGDGLFELVIVRKRELDSFQGVFCTFTNIQEYPMNDVYAPHPTKPDLWLFNGRVDDVIVFSNGETFNPLTMEGIIASHPSIRSALVAGQGKFQTALLIEPSSNKALQAGSVIDEIWPTVQKANQQCAAHAAVSREFILVTSPEKPMLRASKGTVRRKPTLDLYAEELEILYSADASLNLPESLTQLDLGNYEQVRLVLRTLVSSQLSVEQLEDHSSFFELGLDSLKVLSLTKQISSLLTTSAACITSQTILANASVESLARALTMLKSQGSASEDHSSEVVQQYKDMDDLLQCYTPQLNELTDHCTDKTGKETPSRIVILTGSTGSLGSYLLEAFINNPTISQIYCLNRRSESERRQRESQTQKGLSTNFTKAEFLQWDPSQPYLGLANSTYLSLLEQATHIIHNGWEVNLSLPLERFESQLAGIKQFIEFSAQSKRRAHIFFVSSIGAVFNWSDPQNDHVPEIELKEWSLAEQNGYPRAKLIAERILADVSRKYNIPATICRVGQIAGPTGEKGMWPKQEWLPILIKSSMYLGVIPEPLGYLDVVDWVPVNLVADIILELSLAGFDASAEQDARFYHIVNPQKTTWQALLPAIRNHHPQQDSIAITTFDKWLQALRKSADNIDDIKANPAVKLLSFFEDVEKRIREGKKPVLLDTKRAEERSETMRMLGPVGEEWMRRWMRQWGFQQRGGVAGVRSRLA
ncbi:MAG: hypothetical protein Q9225_005246 [Loekoesia sp. 1 TL-2023]